MLVVCKMNRLFTIAKNTFIETLRQPIYAIIIHIALFLFIISPSIAIYTMDDDNKLLREIGLSTLFLTSLFIAIFSSSGAVAEELHIHPQTVRYRLAQLRELFGDALDEPDNRRRLTLALAWGHPDQMEGDTA